MDFFSKLGKKANEAYKVTKDKANEAYKVTKEKATDLSEELKVRGKISEIKEKISKNYGILGQIVYNDIKDGKDVEKDVVVEKCDEISRLQDEISKLEEQLLNIKKVKKCVECSAALNLEDEFCSKCGKSQPKVEKIEVKEEPKEAKETEVTEVSDIQKNEEGKEE